MGLNIQVYLIVFSLLFGFLYCICFILYKKYIRNKGIYILNDFVFNILFTFLFTYIIFRLNYLNLNYYIILSFFIGFLFAYLTVNHF